MQSLFVRTVSAQTQHGLTPRLKDLFFLNHFKKVASQLELPVISEFP